FPLECRYTQSFVDCPPKIDASFQDDLEIDGYIFDFQEGPYPVAIGAYIPREVERLGKNITERTIGDCLAERPEPCPARAQEIDIARFPILPQGHRKHRAAAKPAFGSKKKAGVHAFQSARHEAMVRPAKLRH